jgi:hypothetical protein
MINKETHEKIRKYLDYLLANSSAESPMWNKEKISAVHQISGTILTAV